VTRPRHIHQDVVNEALLNLDRTTVLMAGVADYDELPKLAGPSYDMDMAARLFAENPDVALFVAERVNELHNPTNEVFRNAIAEYAQARSARGDILIIYFTGHGCIMPNGSFGFCLKDTRLGGLINTVLATTAVSAEDVLSTLAVADVYPVLILDACFSSATSPQGSTASVLTVEESLQRHNAETYALLASSSSMSVSVDTSGGGAFTQALYTVVLNGLSDAAGRRSPFITLDQLAGPLQEELSRMGVPLSRCFVGRDFPILPISKNPSYRPQSESFAPYMRRIIELLWNSGNPVEAPISEFSTKIGPGAYANHSKLSLLPWGLVEDAGSNSVRRLTPRGEKFARGEISIPKVIMRDPFTEEWKAAPQTERIRIDEV